MTDYDSRTAPWRARFEEQLEQRLPASSEPPKRLHEAMRYATLAGGKRIRPIMVYASGEALGTDFTQLDGLACAIEIIHAYSLIHDDLPAMDDDDLRRGRPTCHRAFDEATAILAGDALQALAFQIMAENYTDAGAAGLKIIAQLSAACGSTGMAGGQSMDLDAVGIRLDEHQLENMHRLKTGALIHSAVVLPAILTNANATIVDALSSYAQCVGLAFQVHDDILDVTGDSRVTGKTVRADVALNKPTFPSIIGLDASIDRACGLRDQAHKHLNEVPGNTESLHWLADYVIQRDR